MRLPRGAAAVDSVAALILIAISIIGIAGTWDFPARAAMWPLWMWGLLAFFSLILLITSLGKSSTMAGGDRQGPGS